MLSSTLHTGVASDVPQRVMPLSIKRRAPNRKLAYVITYSGSLSSPFFSPSSNTFIGICAGQCRTSTSSKAQLWSLTARSTQARSCS